jgi:hypothetical protein
VATETLYATSHITGAFSNPANAVGSGTGTWAGDVNVNSNYTSRWAMGDPVDPLTSGATHTIAVVARKGSNSGNPTIALNLYENGTLVQSLVGATSVTSTTGQTISGTFSTSAITNPANVEVEVVQVSAGGSPSVRNSAQIDTITWTADVTPIVAQTFVANLLAAPATVDSPGVLRDEVIGAPALLTTSASLPPPGVAVGPVTAVAGQVDAPPTLHPAGVQVGAVAFVALLLAAPAAVASPSTLATYGLVAPMLTAGVNVIQPGTLLAVDITVVVPHVYV